jgi:hypothetical protein
VTIWHDSVRTSDHRRQGAFNWGLRRTGRLLVHLGRWGARGEEERK